MNYFSGKLDIEFDELELARIHSVEFIDSLCVVRKMAIYDNDLGTRIITGNEDIIRPSRKDRLDGMRAEDLMKYIRR